MIILQNYIYFPLILFESHIGLDRLHELCSSINYDYDYPLVCLFIYNN